MGGSYSPSRAVIGDPCPFSRQSEAIKVSKEQAIGAWDYLNRTRPTIAGRLPDLDVALADATRTAMMLATMEKAFGYEQTRQWLETNYGKAVAALQNKEEAA